MTSDNKFTDTLGHYVAGQNENYIFRELFFLSKWEKIGVLHTFLGIESSFVVESSALGNDTWSTLVANMANWHLIHFI